MTSLSFALTPDPDPEPGDTPLPCWGENAWYGRSTCRIRVTTNEDWEWGALGVDFDCGGPPPNHWLAWELDALCRLQEVMRLHHSDVERFLLEEGIAPYQPFWIYMTYRFYPGDGWEADPDSEVEFEVIGMESWSRDRAATAWEALRGRQFTLYPVLE